MKTLTATYAAAAEFGRKRDTSFCLTSSLYPIFTLADTVDPMCFFLDNYPPSGGDQMVSEHFCHTSLDFLENKLSKFISEEDFKAANFLKLIKKTLSVVNQKTKILDDNKDVKKGAGFSSRNKPDIAGIIGFIAKDALYYGYSGGCGLAVYDKKDNLRFNICGEISNIGEKIQHLYPRWQELNKNQQNKIFQRDFCNSLSGDGYGSFNGEPQAKEYFIYDYLATNPSDLIVFYSKGFSPFLMSKRFVNSLRKGNGESLDNIVFKRDRENGQVIGAGRTLVAFQY